MVLLDQTLDVAVELWYASPEFPWLSSPHDSGEDCILLRWTPGCENCMVLVLAGLTVW